MKKNKISYIVDCLHQQDEGLDKIVEDTIRKCYAQYKTPINEVWYKIQGRQVIIDIFLNLGLSNQTNEVQ